MVIVPVPRLARSAVGRLAREVDSTLVRAAARNAAGSMVEGRRRELEEARALRDLAVHEAARRARLLPSGT